MKENEKDEFEPGEIPRGITITELRKIKAFENFSDDEAHEKCKSINEFARWLLAAIPFKQFLKNQNENEKNK